MKKIALSILFSVCILSFSFAQDYQTSIGLRGGFANGLTLKHFVSQNTAFEGIVASRWKGLELTVLYEIHSRAFDVDRLNWYYGFGGHIGFWDGKHAHWGGDGQNYTVIGIDGILGLEYSFEEIPFNISVDWKPAFNFSGHSGFWGDGGAFSIRYMF